MKKIKTNLIISILYQFVAIIYGFILPRLILEHFGSNVNGLIQSISQFLGIIGFLDMGVSQVVRSALYAPLSENDNVQISRIMVSGRKFYRKIALALLGYIVVLMLIYPNIVDHNFGVVYTSALIAIIAIGSFAQYYYGIIHEQIIHASQHTYIVYIIQIICNLFNLILCIIVIRLNCSIHVVKLLTAGVFLLKPIFYARYVQKKFYINWNIKYEHEPITQKWNGVAQHISAVVLDGTDNIVLTLFSTLTNVSIYSVYYMIVGSLQAFYQSVAVSIQSAAGSVWATQEHDRIKKMFSTFEHSLHLATVFLFSCAGILIIPFIQVYTNGLDDANYVQPLFASILVLAYGIRCLRTPYNIWILAAGHFRQTQRCHIMAAGLNLIVSIIAVSRWGLVGVAIGTLIAMFYQTSWVAVYTTKKLIKCPVLHIIKRAFVDLTAVVIAYTATSWITLKEISFLSWFVMAIKVAAIAAVSIGTVFLLFYPKETLQYFKTNMPDKHNPDITNE